MNVVLCCVMFNLVALKSILFCHHLWDLLDHYFNAKLTVAKSFKKLFFLQLQSMTSETLKMILSLTRQGLFLLLRKHPLRPVHLPSLLRVLLTLDWY